MRLNVDQSERVLYDNPEYPVYVRKGLLSAFPNYTAESHWHDDVEFISVLSGQMLYNINGEIVVLREGEGVFVNARQLHFGFSNDKTECAFICVLVHPMVICSSEAIEKDYINPIIFNENIPYYHLKKTNEWENGVLCEIEYIYNAAKEKTAELKIQKAFLGIWIALCENIVTLQKTKIARNQNLNVLKNMISFIHRNYKEKLTLRKIASAGNMGKTGCCGVFKKYTNKTPIEYLTEFRLRKAIELLRDTDMTVLEISCETGFSGASYFSETFRKFYGCTPSEYKKNVLK